MHKYIKKARKKCIPDCEEQSFLVNYNNVISLPHELLEQCVPTVVPVSSFSISYLWTSSMLMGGEIELEHNVV